MDSRIQRPNGADMSNARRLNPSWTVLAALTLVSGTVLVIWQSHITFFFDDWDLLFNRPGISAHTLLEPHNEHIILAPALIYKLLQSIIGMESTTPYAVASTACFLASVVLLFIYLRGRVGDWLAVIAVTPILFMGSAYEDLLIPFQIGYFGSMAFGIGALLALERRSDRGDLIACVLLVCSLTFAEIGISFVLAMALAIALNRDRRGRFYVVLVPLALYGLWYAGWGHHAQHSVSLQNIVDSPAFVLNGGQRPWERCSASSAPPCTEARVGSAGAGTCSSSSYPCWAGGCAGWECPRRRSGWLSPCSCPSGCSRTRTRTSRGRRTRPGTST